MKSIVKTLLAASLSIAAVSACSEEKLAPSTSGTKTTVHFGAVSSIVDNATKATLTPNATEDSFEGRWENGDELSVRYHFDYDETGEETVATWTGNSFDAKLPVLTGDWIYYAAYPVPDADSHVDFGSNRTQKGNAYNSKYDIMIGSALAENAAAGKDDEGNNIVFNMERQTAIAYFHFTSNLDEAIKSATLSVAGDNAYIASNSASVSDFKWTAHGDCTSITVTFPEEAPSAKDFQLWFNVLPTEYTAMSLTIETATKTLTINKSTSGSYEAGHLYRVNKKSIPEDKWVEKKTSLLELVTDASTLKVGDKLIIASTSKDMVAGPLAVTDKGTQQDYLSAIAYDFDLSKAPNGALIFILAGDSNAWTLNNTDGESLGSTSAKKLTFDKEGTNYIGTWTIAVDEYNNATIASTNSPYGKILYNSSKPRFLNYTSNPTTAMLLPQLYRYHGAIRSKSNINLNNAEIKTDAANTLRIGKVLSLEATTNSTAALTYSSDTPEVASVDDNGVITALTEGSATITISVAENDEYYAAEKEVTVNVVGKYEQEITYTDASKILVVGNTLNLKANAKGELSYSSDNEEIASVSNDGIVKAIAEGKAVITISAAETDEYKASTTTVEITVRPEGTQTKHFVKVTTAPTDWSGTYLIVYEDGNVAFNGSLPALDAVENTISVTITDNMIEETDDLLKSTFEIAKIGTTDNYSIKSASGYYIGYTADKNGMTTDQETVYNNAISFSNGNIEIKAGIAPSILKFNDASGQKRFRYYKSGQKDIQLYRLED